MENADPGAVLVKVGEIILVTAIACKIFDSSWPLALMLAMFLGGWVVNKEYEARKVLQKKTSQN